MVCRPVLGLSKRRHHPAARPRGCSERAVGKKMGTNKCLVKQLLCLYPLPHFSQRSSTRLLFLPSLVRGWPSLARRIRAVWRPPSASSADISLESSSIALSCPSGFGCIAKRFVGRLAGGEGRLPTMAARAAADLDIDIVLRRALTAMGREATLSPPS